MIAKVYSAIPDGYDGRIVEVESDSRRSLPAFNIVGMADKTISEARERVRSAIMNSDFRFPDKKVTVNLAPADLNKTGSHLDLPIALSVLVLSGQLLQKDLDHKLFVGELSLNGHTKPVRGIINIVEAARDAGFKEVFLPTDNLREASLVSGIKLTAVPTLLDLVLHLHHAKPLPKPNVVKNTETDTDPCSSIFYNTQPQPTDQPILLDQIKDQAFAKRALLIALAGHHNLLLSGPPGAGKTLLARAAANLLPPLTPDEQLEITKLYALTQPLGHPITTPPFRAPHHTASTTALVGSATHPGEISLAHHGILLLDEIAEFPRSVLETLRQPLEDRHISIARAHDRITYPADFILIATMNPCPCGYLGDPNHTCTCTSTQIQRYRSKLSGPILDRIDLIVNVNPVHTDHLLSPAQTTNKEHVATATAIARCRAHQSDEDANDRLSKPALALLGRAAETLKLSARAYFKTINLSRTIADLADSPTITPEHISEALAFRPQLE